MMSRSVYIFRGAPASGKGTIVPAFAKAVPGPVALLEQDTFRWHFHLIGRTVPDITEAEHRLAYQNMLLVYEAYLKNGQYTIVLEGLFTWAEQESQQGCMLQLIALAKAYHFTVYCFVLTADKSVLLERNAQRPYSVPVAEFNQLYEGIYSVIDASEIIINSSTETAETTTERLKAQVVV